MPSLQTILSIPFLLAALFLIPSPAAADDNYGAITYSVPDGAWGYSYNFNSQGRANREALQYCRGAGGSDCRVVLRVVNSCGALAIGAKGWGLGTGNSRARAEREARSACQGYSSGCTIRVWVCTAR